jgi:hypothetical protein
LAHLSLGVVLALWLLAEALVRKNKTLQRTLRVISGAVQPIPSLIHEVGVAG